MNSPASKRTFEPHPAIVARCEGSIPAKNGCALRSLSMASMPFLLAPADRRELLRDVDSRRAPGDAAPAPDAAGHAELVDPCRELVAHPLAVARPRVRPQAPAVDVRELERAARVPLPRPRRVPAREVGGVFDRRAEAGGADHRAVAAREAALRHVVPPRVVVLPVEELLHPFGREPAAVLRHRAV